MALTREQILNVNDIERKEIEIPEWGGTVWIRQLTRGEQDAYLKRQMGGAKVKAGKKDIAGEFDAASIYGHDTWLCSRGICDEEGKPLFNEKDVDALAKKNGTAIGRIAQEIVQFSGMAEDLPVEEEAKN
ncbi:MAG: hypothetical protein LC114_17895 [Bryobacterales bacterium]|nr:hypothetical protein [Bryobacterales bacterium]